ncbi:8-oxo-dGTP diphosphatase [Brevundimonas phage vB_BpoS-Gurke]|uniref:8-oxo-dGTP diphosphatase n=1 Tax=Brevundimonas phage vB_BpoS-Gurke TaxID=2948599 RepID=A0A9E7N3N1_9CAUD|nr:8-oxo-dGTP diphosphatase [Brevundimonas phage vB_BpoS-Gurke]
MNPPHCSACGAAFHPEQRAARHPECLSCGTFNWQNPRPVVNFLQPVLTESGLGLAVARRGIAPDQGSYALPGGFVEIGEHTRQAAAREFFEESGFQMDYRQLVTLGDLPSTAGTQMLIFVMNKHALSIPQFMLLKDTDEMYDWAILTQDSDIQLCWPTHRVVAHQWLASQPQQRGSYPIRPDLLAFAA